MQHSAPQTCPPPASPSTRLGRPRGRRRLARRAAALLLGGISLAGLAPATTAAAAAPAQLTVRVRFVRVADDDGGRAGWLSKAAAEADIAAANQIFARDGGRIRLVLSPGSDFANPVKSTVMNDDCTIVNGHTAASIAKVVIKDVDGNGSVEQADARMLCDELPTHAARTEYALQYPHELVVFVRSGHTLTWSDLPAPAKSPTQSRATGSGKGIAWREPMALSHWSIVPVGAFSSEDTLYVALFSGPYQPPGRLLAHELGHYFHLRHTFAWRPATKNGARELLESFAKNNPTLEPMLVFDGDGLSDTRPDPGGALVETVFGDGCSLGKISVAYTNAKGLTTEAILDPERDNTMSYYHKCPLIEQRFSTQQHDIMNASLLEGNRHVLLVRRAKICKDAEVDAFPDPLDRLHARVKSVVDCMKLTKQPLPWETMVQVDPSHEVARPGDRRTAPRDPHAAVVERLLAAQPQE